MVLVIFPVIMRNCTTFSFDHRKEKDNRFLNNSSKACDAHLYMQNQIRAVCTECIMPSHIMSFKTSQMESVDRPTDGQQPSVRIQSSFSIYLLKDALPWAHTKKDTVLVPLRCERLSAPAGLIPELGKSGKLP